jgi:Helix-turn-helix domain
MTETSIALSARAGANESHMPPGRSGDASDGSLDYWNALIPEQDAAGFLNITRRTLQAFRQKGGGPIFARLSARCIRYRRRDLQVWAEARVRTSTSDPGEANK